MSNAWVSKRTPYFSTKEYKETKNEKLVIKGKTKDKIRYKKTTNLREKKKNIKEIYLRTKRSKYISKAIKH